MHMRRLYEVLVTRLPVIDYAKYFSQSRAFPSAMEHFGGEWVRIDFLFYMLAAFTM